MFQKMGLKKLLKTGLFYALLPLGILTQSSRCSDDEPNLDDLSDIAYAPKPYVLEKPKDFPEMPIPPYNPLTVEGVELGRRLFFDPILSRDSSMACVSCHLPAFAFTDGRANSKGVDGISGVRSSMSLANIGYLVSKGVFWDGRSRNLEEQALLPIEDPIELHARWEDVEKKLRNHPDYAPRFRRAFGVTNRQEISKNLVALALAQFERTIISSDAKVDKIARDEARFNDDELSGWQLFFNEDQATDAQCGHCHTSPFYTSNEFFNNGLDSVLSLDDFKDKGLGGFTRKRFDNGKFRAPSLRNIEFTAPYMHDGRFKTLEEVVNHYASGGHYAENLDPFLPQIARIQMSPRQKRQIISFLKTLSDTTFLRNPKFQSPFK
jgi:cytochrome c peroxidase